MDNLRKKDLVDRVVKYLLLGVTLLSASIICFIVLFILVKGFLPFLNTYEENWITFTANLPSFLFGQRWATPKYYGVFFIVINTIYVVFIACLISVPISIFTSLFVVKIAPKWIAKVLEYTVGLLSSIPSIIYGLFGMGVVTVFVKNISNVFGYQSAGGISTLATSIVLAMMIMPTITMVSITSIRSVNEDIVLGSLALGASKTQTNFKIVLKKAQSGIISGIILGVGRALGEATAVSMVAGNSGTGPNFNIFDTTRTLTSTMLSGLTETTGFDLDIRYSVAIVLVILIFVMNFILNAVKRRLER